MVKSSHAQEEVERSAPTMSWTAMRYSKLDEVAVLTEPSEEILKSDMLGGARLLVSSKEEAMLAGSDKRSRARAHTATSDASMNRRSAQREERCEVAI